MGVPCELDLASAAPFFQEPRFYIFGCLHTKDDFLLLNPELCEISGVCGAGGFLARLSFLVEKEVLLWPGSKYQGSSLHLWIFFQHYRGKLSSQS